MTYDRPAKEEKVQQTSGSIAQEKPESKQEESKDTKCSNMTK
jgi:hypothetical protein